MRVARSKGAVSGPLLIILGLWAAFIPFVGPYFDYGFGADQTWLWHTSRLWMNVLPGAVVVVAGLVLAGLAERITMAVGAWLAAAAGAWLVVAPVVSSLWNGHTSLTGTPLGGPTRQSLEYLGFYYGLGAVILFLGALALGRLSVVDARERRLVHEAVAVPVVEAEAPVVEADPTVEPAPGVPPASDPARAPQPGTRRRAWLRGRHRDRLA